MRTAVFTALLLQLFFFRAPIAQSDEIDLQLLDDVRKRYALINDLKCTFTQQTQIKDFKKNIVSSGKVWFKKPAMMKWRYEEPWKDVIVSDGKKIWYYDSRENLITQADAGEFQEDFLGSYTVVSILENLKSFFEVSENLESPDERGNILLDLKDRKREMSKKVTIAIDPKNHMLRKIIVRDVFSSVTVIELEPVEINSGVADSFFGPEKPEGAKIVTFP